MCSLVFCSPCVVSSPPSFLFRSSAADLRIGGVPSTKISGDHLRLACGAMNPFLFESAEGPSVQMYARLCLAV